MQKNEGENQSKIAKEKNCYIMCVCVSIVDRLSNLSIKKFVSTKRQWRIICLDLIALKIVDICDSCK